MPGSVLSRHIITHHPRFARAALEEVRSADPLVVCSRSGSLETTYVASELTREQFATRLLESRPVFLRHVAPIERTVELSGRRTDIDLVVVSATMLWLPRDATFAVQCRKSASTIAGHHIDAAYTIRDVEIAVGVRIPNAYEPTSPEWVISIYLDGACAHLGCSRASENLSVYADETRRPKHPPTVISRAEHKLREALDVFAVQVTAGATALDLGAAPGGWAYLLAESGLSVIAVDPAKLDRRVSGHPRVTHLRERADLSHLRGQNFALVANDMALDPAESAGILAGLARDLAPGTPVVMTIKLPTLNARSWIGEAVSILAPTFAMQGMRHLFHNRQEVTVVLRRR